MSTENKILLLKELAKLKSDGILSEDEFQKEKQKILHPENSVAEPIDSQKKNQPVQNPYAKYYKLKTIYREDRRGFLEKLKGEPLEVGIGFCTTRCKAERTFITAYGTEAEDSFFKSGKLARIMCKGCYRPTPFFTGIICPQCEISFYDSYFKQKQRNFLFNSWYWVCPLCNQNRKVP